MDLCFQKIFEVRKDRVRYFVQDRIELRLCEDARLYKVESLVDGVERHHDKAQYQNPFRYCEQSAEQLVEPSEHHNLYDLVQKFADKR